MNAVAVEDAASVAAVLSDPAVDDAILEFAEELGGFRTLPLLERG